MRARWFLVIGIVAGGLGALAWMLARGRVQPASQSPALVGTDLFKSVFSYVRSNAVDSLTDQDLYRRAAAGVIDELDDPYAVLLLPGREPPPPPDVPAPQGLYLDRRDGSVVIVTTVPGSPAELAGVQSGDLLLGVDTIPVDDLRHDQAVRLLDGSLGSKVSLRLRRAGRRGLVTVDVIRGRLPRAASVDTASLPGAVGRLIIRGFPKGIEDSVRLAALALRDRGARSLVLDLRGAVGGDLAQGASVADLFLDAGVSIVQSRSRRSADSVDFRDSTASSFDSIPIAVLVDAGTAGAAEVVAGALQDHDRAAVLGAITFGRGVTQSTFPLGSGASLRLTTALWLTPRGRQIQRPPRRADGDTIPRPRLKSEGGRVLLGGGGIVPDRMVLSAGTGDSVLTLARSILVRGGTTRAVLALVTAH
jgi:carboxyl-terminal processing protease